MARPFILLFMLFLTVSPAVGQNRTGVANLDTLMATHPLYPAFEKKLNEEVEKCRRLAEDEIIIEKNPFKDASPEEMERIKEELVRREEIRMAEIGKCEENLERLRQELEDSLMNLVKEEVSVLAKEEGYGWIVSEGSVLYQRDVEAIDITAAVLERRKK